MLNKLLSAVGGWLSPAPTNLAKERIQPYFDNDAGAYRVNPLLFQFGMGRPSLVIVDMQVGFLCKEGTTELYYEHYQSLVDEVEALVVEAVGKRWKVFVLEYEGFGSTLWEIVRHLENYPLAVRLTKSKRDGSYDVVRVNEQSGGSDEYLVCGCYADQCVEETVVNLARSQPQSLVKVVPKACLPYEQDFQWRCFPTAANLLLARAA